MVRIESNKTRPFLTGGESQEVEEVDDEEAEGVEE